MRVKEVVKAVKIVVLITPFFFMTGCFKTQSQVMNETLRKQPTHILNVPSKQPTAIDGVWHNPAIGKQCSMMSGREIVVWKITPQAPPFPSVLVRDIERVAPGRYRGVAADPGQKGITVTYSIIGKGSLLSRWHFPSGEKKDCVYDKVKLTSEQWFLREYEAFLKESRGGGAASQEGRTHAVRRSGESVTGQTRSVSEKPSFVLYKMYTKPGRVTAGTKFDLIIEYAVTDPAVQSNRISATVNLEILKTKNAIQTANLKNPGPPVSSRTDKIHSFKPVDIDAPNGKKTKRIFHLSAAKEKGSYYLVAILKYKKTGKKWSLHLPID